MSDRKRKRNEPTTKYAKMSQAIDALQDLKKIDDWVLFDYARDHGDVDGYHDALRLVLEQFEAFRRAGKHLDKPMHEQIDVFVNVVLKPAKGNKSCHKSVYPFIQAAIGGKQKSKSECVGYAKAYSLMCTLMGVPHVLYASETHLFVMIKIDESMPDTSSPLTNAFILCVNRKVMNTVNKVPANNYNAGLWTIVDSMYAQARRLNGRDTIALTIVNEVSDPVLSAELIRQVGADESNIWLQQRLRNAQVQECVRKIFAGVRIHYPMAALDVAKLLLSPHFLDQFLDSIDPSFEYPPTIFLGSKDEEEEDFLSVFSDVLKAEKLGIDDAESMWARAKQLALRVCNDKDAQKIINAFDALKNMTKPTSKYLKPLERRR